MSKKTILVLFGFVLLFGFNLAQAKVVINEVQISPVAGRFIELYNADDFNVDLTGWYIQRKTANSDEFTSLVPKKNFENKTINANSYFLISKDTLGLSSFTLTESNIIQLKKSEKEIVDKIGWGDCAEVCVSENPSEGKSIQKSSDGWSVATPTPGEENQNLENNEEKSDEENGEEAENKTKLKTEVPTMKAKIITNTFAFAGEPLEMETDIFGYADEKVVLGKAYWNFGDGDSLEQINNFEKFYHTFYYPGEYIVFLEYYSKKAVQNPEATNKVVIKVLPTTVTISKVGDAKDFFIELTNNANSDIDISNWVIKANGKIFTLPKNSVIMSKKQMTISSKITGFNINDKYNLKLFSSTGELIFDYNVPLVNKYTPKTISPKTVSRSENNNQIENETASSLNLNLINKNSAPMLEGQVPVDNLGAEAIKSVTPLKGNLKYGVFGLIAFLGISTSAAYFIRSRKTIPQKIGNDFEIIDE
jgi:hypothetical protein